MYQELKDILVLILNRRMYFEPVYSDIEHFFLDFSTDKERSREAIYLK